MTLKTLILQDINNILFCKNVDKGRISVFSMKMFYHLTSEIFVKEDIDIKISYNIAGLCADNIECMINNLFVMQKQLKLLTDEEIYIMIHNIILTNIKY